MIGNEYHPSWSVRLLVLSIITAISYPSSVTFAFFLNPLHDIKTKSSSSSASLLSNSTESFQLRIRTAHEDDLAKAAVFLSTASTSESRGGWFSFQSKIDQLFAQSDIEALLKDRYRAIEAGKASYTLARRQLEKHVKSSQQDETRYIMATTTANNAEVLSNQSLLQYWWNNGCSGKFKSLIQKAAESTGENNVWRDHNFALTPWTETWFHHLQMTAEDSVTGEIIGFCEIAMLENPLEPSDDDDGPVFAPAISNLATAPAWRRRGVATRLLKSAQNYASRHWKAKTLALYVDQDNDAAMELYERMGFRKTITCSCIDKTMWYMMKPLSLEHDNVQDEAVEIQMQKCNPS